MQRIAALLPIITLILTLTASISQARLGETDTKCDVRYNSEGKKIEPSYSDKHSPLNVGAPLETTTYSYQGWSIRIGFQSGFARCMEYSKPYSAKPTDAEINAILRANELGGTWQQISFSQVKTNATLEQLWKYTGNMGSFGSGFWLRSDGSVAYLAGGSKIRLEHKKALDIALKQTREAEAAKKKPVPKF